MDDLERLLNSPELDEPGPDLDDRMQRLFDEAERRAPLTKRKRPPILRALAAAAAILIVGLVVNNNRPAEEHAPPIEPATTTTRTIYVVQSNADPQYPAKTTRTPQFWDGEVTTEIITQTETPSVSTQQEVSP